VQCQQVVPIESSPSLYCAEADSELTGDLSVSHPGIRQ
jgi:hypothetical protein